MELLRRDADYALRAVAVLARAKRGELISAGRMARAERLSEALLRKILLRLARAEIVESVMGKEGGWRIARDPAKVSALEVVEAVQGQIAVNPCFHGPGRCPNQKSCAMRDKLKPVQTRMRSLLKELTLSELAGNG